MDSHLVYTTTTDCERGPDGWPVVKTKEEDIAKIIYRNSCCHENDYVMIFEKEQTPWLELAEHERDDYRIPARKLIEYLKNLEAKNTET